MARSRFLAPAMHRQRGATLVIALVILVLIMMIGITAISTSDTQFKLAGNLQFEDSALNNAESAVNAAEFAFASGALRYSDSGFTTYAQGATPHLYPIATAVNPLTINWVDQSEDGANANSMMVAGSSAQRFIIQMLSTNNRLQGSSQVVGGRTSTGCNQVNTYLITGRGVSARGSTKFVQSVYSVLSCPS